MELLADYNLDIVYHPGKANQVVDALIRRKVNVSETKEVQDLFVTLASLRLSTTTVEDKITVLDDLDQADLLERISKAQQGLTRI